MKALLRACGQVSLLVADLWVLHQAVMGTERRSAEIVVLCIVHLWATVGFATLAARKLGHNRLAAAFIIAVAGVFVPVIGLIGATIAIRMAGMPTARDSDPRCSLFDTESRALAGNLSSDVSMSRLRAVLGSRAEPSQRIAALLAASKLDPRSAITLYKLALKDPIDEVRLLAFSKLEGHRRTVEGRIASLRTTLEKEEDPLRLAAAHHRLAEAHDELAYSGLVEGDAQRDALERAAEHALIASQTESTNRGSVLFTLGRILLRSGALSKAQHAFDEARSCGVPSQRTAPYVAEIAFKTRDFGRVRSHVRFVGGKRRHQTRLRNVVAFWR